MRLLASLPPTCTAEDAADLLRQVAPTLGLTASVPDVRTLRLWRSKQWITVEARHFTRRNLLEVLALLKLRQDGLAHQTAVTRIRTLEEDRLYLLLTAATPLPLTPTDAEPLITLQLLAKGILEQYRYISQGAILGHTNRQKTGMENTPQRLQQAMARLGKHYLSEAQEDRAASVHELLQLCMRPLMEWAPRALADLESYRHAILIDPRYRVPSEDCESIAEEADGTSLSDLIERRLHHELCATLKKLGTDADRAYTIIREFVGRHPLATATELQHLYLNPELNDDAITFVRGLYAPVHAEEARDGLVRRCAHCQGLITRQDACILVGCAAEHAPAEMGTVPLHNASLARPEVLKYWADPAREELRIYDALRRMPALKGRVALYPHSDWCDIAIDEEAGVDVKDYHDPVRLARRLNRSIGNLTAYPVRILAIAQRRWSSSYRDQLLEQLAPDTRALLRVQSVNDTIRLLKTTYGRGERPHATQA